ncbi:unnamed protein product [Discosporangium mesarthrocarpum]
MVRRREDFVTKEEVRWRLMLLQQAHPWARPPRRLLRELNEFFIPGEAWWGQLRDKLLHP